MNLNEMTRKMARETRQAFRCHAHIKDTVQARAYQEPPEGSGQAAINIKANYGLMYVFNGLTVDKLNSMWRQLELWADRHAGIPQRFVEPLGGKIRLRRMMACKNVLTDEQNNTYVVVPEEFTAVGVGLNRYERFFELLDAYQDWVVVFTRRLNWWQDEWALQGATPRENQVIAILNQTTTRLGSLSAELADLTILTRDQKGDATAVEELRVRARFTKPRRLLAGGLHAINRGVTTTAGVTGGNPLAAGPEPDEFDPDVETVRDEPALGTDPAP